MIHSKLRPKQEKHKSVSPMPRSTPKNMQGMKIGMSRDNFVDQEVIQKKKVHVAARKIHRMQYVEENFHTDSGAPFKFIKRQYLRPLYNVARRLLVIMASRQAEKSSFAAKNMIYELSNNDHEMLMYATASQEHLNEFVHKKINQQFDFNSHLQASMLGPGALNNVKNKRYLNGGMLANRAIGQNAQSARGVTARKIYFDETQSILSDNIPIVKECAQSFPDTSEYVFLGTPLTSNNQLSILYKDSKQWEWIITCTHCFKRNPPLGMDHIDETKPFLFCVFCGKEMDPARGRWESMNHEGEYDGFRICRLMTPTCRWKTEAKDGILDKLKEYSFYQFKNEVLGLPEDTGVVPVTKEEIHDCCADYQMIDPLNPPSWIYGRKLGLTIDWAWSTKESGKSFTIIALWAKDSGVKLRCLYAKRYVGGHYEDPEAVLAEIVRIVTTCGVKIIGTDYGIGHKENVRLSGMLKSHQVAVAEFMYAGTHEKPQWQRIDKRYHVGRTPSLDRTFSMLKKGDFQFPIWEEIEPYANDILNVYTEMDPNMKRVKYEHAGTGPDDFLHLMNYAQMISTKGAL